jgi:hypothetical protein
LVHSIPIGEVKNMKSDVLWALKGSLSGKKFKPLKALDSHMWDLVILGRLCKCNKFLDFLKLFEVVDMDCSFPMRQCYMYRLDLWFKSYEVFKISAQVGICCQPLLMKQNLPKTAQNYQNLPKDETLKFCQKLRF